MKRALAFTICIIMALGCGIFTAYAGHSYLFDELLEKIDLEARFDQWAVENDKAKYMTSITGDEYNSGFEEIYLHTTKESASEWALVWVPCDLSLEREIDVQVGRTVIHSADEGLVFRTHYGIYDAAEDTFYDMDGIDIEKYPDIESLLCQLKIGRPIGDADNDNELTVLDATRIQRVLTELDRFVDRINDYCCGLGGAVRHFSDYDGDGDTTILDATAIQRHLAGLTTEA